MSVSELSARVASRSARIGVVGLGAVGVAVAAAFAGAGFAVVGVDVDPSRVANLGAEDEPDLAELLATVIQSGRLVATTDFAALAEADVVLVAVATPVIDRRPDLSALTLACESITSVAKDGALVIVESTLPPGTCERVLAPILGARLHLGHAPERVMPTRRLANLRRVPRMCGAASREIAEAMATLYATIGDGRIDRTDWLTAELAKTAENTYRDVNIAFANELAAICEAHGADFRAVRELVNRSPGRDVLFAGPGVGGACLPKDPWLLVAGAGAPTPLVAAARAVNDAMPSRVVAKLEETLGVLEGARIVLLGWSYLENAGIALNSPSSSVASLLRARGAHVVLHDPHVAEHAGPLAARLEGADALVLMVAHDAYRALDLAALAPLMRRRVLVDTRHVLDAREVNEMGFHFAAIGRPTSRT
jgi:UDP-N-acetyl-D-mannosaminuronic acid dehydrogenase